MPLTSDDEQATTLHLLPLPILRTIAALAAALAFSLLGAVVAQAAPPPGQEPEVHSWAVAPTGSLDPNQPGNRPNLSYDAAPGSTIQDSVTVFNYGSVALTFRLYATDAYNNADGQFDVLPGDRAPVDAGAWVTLPQANLTVPAGAQAALPISITVPATASPGDHAGAVLATSQVGGTGRDGKVVNVDRRTGARMYVRVAGPLSPSLSVEKVSTSYKPSFNPLRGEVEVVYRVENRGNVRLDATEHVSVSGPLGIAEQRSPRRKLAELLPGQAVERRVTFDGVPAAMFVSSKIVIEPSEAVKGDPKADVERVETRSVALPLTVLAVGLVAVLVRYARRSYLRHTRDGLAGSLAT